MLFEETPWHVQNRLAQAVEGMGGRRGILQWWSLPGMCGSVSISLCMDCHMTTPL